ncbi:hypothetical protein PtA15_4A678 [Puccinia triticina]|uniref:Secreted protein n=1 Tax=Puccinia triticina TaxID=208348 RepID=A0ABY7CG78_9BASI|nr:uncharacterized protein PtA15_4A678 [Puccinia triticina]WAQ84226.1 hypothetical protein PtA15_4A678 [Puccinia triticina]WAR55054.1 hypothetical protein PtB15_4B673 [Puccinia triticina]
MIAVILRRTTCAMLFSPDPIQLFEATSAELLPLLEIHTLSTLQPPQQQIIPASPPNQPFLTLHWYPQSSRPSLTQCQLH